VRVGQKLVRKRLVPVSCKGVLAVTFMVPRKAAAYSVGVRFRGNSQLRPGRTVRVVKRR
jgi:hypothetical protein